MPLGHIEIFTRVTFALLWLDKILHLKKSKSTVLSGQLPESPHAPSQLACESLLSYALPETPLSSRIPVTTHPPAD